MKRMLSKSWVLMIVLFFFYAVPYATAGDVNYTYDNAGRLIKAEYDNGISIQYTYDNAGNLLSRVVSSGQPGTYTLTVNKAGTGTGTVTGPGINCGSDCSESCNEGESVTLNAKADANSSFTGWSGGGCSGTGTCQVVMNSSITITASFGGKVPDISVQTSLDFGSGAVGKSIKKILSITNNGAGALSITSFEGLAGTDFSTTASSATVKAKKTYKLKLTFKATSAGAKTATLRINSNDPDTPTVEVTLSGTGL